MSDPTSRWKILISDGLEESGLALLRNVAQVDDRCGISAAGLLEIIGTYDALIIGGRTQVNEAVLQAAPQLKVIGRAGLGIEGIDLAAVSAHQVKVVNTPEAHNTAVAEMILGLLLALARSIPRADSSLKSGQWLSDSLPGIEISGRTLGILGLSSSGQILAHKAGALGMRVLVYDPQLPPAVIAQHAAQPVTQGELYAQADFISLHLPFNTENRRLISGQTLGQMKRGVYLVSATRGGMIDETALLGALETGQVAGAALDAFASEPPGLSALVAHPRVIATPHISAHTIEAQQRAAEAVAQEVIAALRGEPLRWQVV